LHRQSFSQGLCEMTLPVSAPGVSR
jgi:hypothetical protein